MSTAISISQLGLKWGTLQQTSLRWVPSCILTGRRPSNAVIRFLHYRSKMLNLNPPQKPTPAGDVRLTQVLVMCQSPAQKSHLHVGWIHRHHPSLSLFLSPHVGVVQTYKIVCASDVLSEGETGWLGCIGCWPLCLWWMWWSMVVYIYCFIISLLS